MAGQTILQPIQESLVGVMPTIGHDVRVIVGRDNNGAINVVNNLLTLETGSPHGDILLVNMQGDQPLVEARPRPVDRRPRDFPALIGRREEIRTARGALRAAQPVEFYAIGGMGKTALLRHLAHRAADFKDGIVYLAVESRPPADLRQRLHDAFYASRLPVKHLPNQIEDDLSRIEALIILDDVDYNRETVEQLLAGMPRSTFLLASAERHLWGEGRPTALGGLTPDEGIELFQRELGRAIRPDEMADLRQFIIAQGGHPLTIIQAAALAAKERDRALGLVLGRGSPAALLLPALSPEEKKLLAGLKALNGAAVGQEHLAALLQTQDIRPALIGLSDKGFVEETEDGRYRLADSPTVLSGWDVSAYQAWFAGHFARWSSRNQANPTLIGREAEAIRATLNAAAEAGRHQDVLRLARALDAPLTLDKQWAAWGEALEQAEAAARSAGLPADEAWALHQQGTRRLALGERAAAESDLERALSIRRGLGDQVGAELTRYHLDLLRFLPWPPGSSPAAPPGPPPSPFLGWLQSLPFVGRAILGIAPLLMLAMLAVVFIKVEPPPVTPVPAQSLPMASPTPTLETPIPSVVINSPVAGRTFGENEAVSFSATAVDPDGSDVAASLVWTDDNGEIGRGATFSRTLPPGDHTITAVVSTADGRSGRAVVEITVVRNEPPAVSITAPAGETAIEAGTPLTFSGAATDPEDGDLSDALTWKSDIDGPIGSGRSFTRALSPGRHTITAEASDGGGLSAEASVDVIVAEPPDPLPEVRILTPANGSIFAAGAVISFSGAATDAPNGNLSGSLRWFSNLDGFLGQGPSLLRSLSPGNHAITALVADSKGQEGAATIFLVVQRPTTPPAVRISSPVAQNQAGTPSLYFGDRPILFAAVAFDAEEGDISDRTVWTSDRDGRIGVGRAFERTLSEGRHRLTATVTDATGLSATAVVEIEVRRNTEPAVRITAPSPTITGSVVLVEEWQEVTFAGTADDAEEGDLSAALVWRSSLEGEIGRGASLPPRKLGVGEHVITATVIDSGGLEAGEQVTVQVKANTPPEVAILVIERQSQLGQGKAGLMSVQAQVGSFKEGDTIRFVGRATDAEEGDLSARIVWTSSLDGMLGESERIAKVLTPGVHTITATVADSGGLSDSGEATITVAPVTVTPDALPVVVILSPKPGEIAPAGQQIGFAATADDPEDGDVRELLTWSSDIGGVIGQGGGFERVLSVGTHTITASATDGRGKTGSATVTVTVVNEPPTVTIVAPKEGEYAAGRYINFAAEANDQEDGDLTRSVVWTSDRDGRLGQGLFETRLSIGVHTITALATDSQGQQGGDTVVISVVDRAPQLTIRSPLDGADYYEEGSEIAFSAEVFDEEDLSKSVVWTSDIDGVIGSGGDFVKWLSPGRHVITVAVTDGAGQTATAGVTIYVKPKG